MSPAPHTPSRAAQDAAAKAATACPSTGPAATATAQHRGNPAWHAPTVVLAGLLAAWLAGTPQAFAADFSPAPDATPQVPLQPAGSTGGHTDMATPPPRAALAVVAPVDLQRYAGTWYEQARLPNRFQQDCAGQVTAQYRVQDDGRLSVRNRCILRDGEVDEAQGEARAVPVEGRPGAGQLQVRFAPRWLGWLPLVWGDYWILRLDPQYQTALVGTPDRKYLWVLSRAPRMEPAALDAQLQAARHWGFPVEQVLRTPAEPALP